MSSGLYAKVEKFLRLRPILLASSGQLRRRFTRQPGAGRAGALLTLHPPDPAPPFNLAESYAFVGVAATNNQAVFAALSLGLGLVHEFLSQKDESVSGLTVTVVGDSLLAVNVELDHFIRCFFYPRLLRCNAETVREQNSSILEAKMESRAKLSSLNKLR